MAESKVYKLLNGVDVTMVGEAVEVFLRDGKSLITEAAKTQEGYIVQAKQEADGWKRISGTDMAIKVQIFAAGDVINVTIGHGKWSDKIGAGVIGAAFFAPLMLAAGIGAYFQKKLPDEIFDFIEKFILSGGQSAMVSSGGGKKVSSDEVVCPNCKTVNKSGVKFCCECGTKLGRSCPQCGADIAEGVKFCPECGASTVVELKCPNCGADHAEGQKFCPECGTALN